MSGKRAIGIDIGATKIAVGLVDVDGRVTDGATLPTDVERGAGAIAERVVAMARGLSREGVVGAGIATVGQVDPRQGRIIAASRQMPGDWAGTPLRDLVGDALGLPARMANDGQAMALAELRFGAARGARQALCLAVGTGIGGALIVDGRLHLGARGIAGQFGHTLVEHGGRECPCGERGHLEAYAGGAAIGRRYRELGGRGEDIFAAARAGEEVATRVVGEAMDYLAAGLTGLVNLFDPEIVVLGGGVVAAAPEMVDNVRRALTTRVLPAVRSGLRVEAALLGPDAGMIGAAALFFDD